MPGVPFAAIGAGLGQWAQQAQQQQAQRERNMMLMMTLQRFRQEMEDRQQERSSAEGLWGAIGSGGSGIKPVNPAPGGGGVGVPMFDAVRGGDGSYSVPPTPRAPAAPTFGAAGEYGGAGSMGEAASLPGSPVATRQRPMPGPPAQNQIDYAGPGASGPTTGLPPPNMPAPRFGGLNAQALQPQTAQAAPQPQVADAGPAPAAAPLPIPDLRKRLNAIIPPDANGRMSEAALKAKIDEACPTCPAVYKLKYLDSELKRLAPMEAERVRLAHEKYKTQIDAETKMWEEEVKRQDRKETGGAIITGAGGEQYSVQGRTARPITIEGTGEQLKDATRLGGTGGSTASAGREKDIVGEIKRLDDAYAAANPNATKAEKDAAHFNNRKAAEKEITKVRTTESRASPSNIVMRKLMDEHPEWSGDDLLRAANKITAQQSIERRYGGGQGANQMAALNTVADHLKLMQDYASVLRNGDTPFTEIPRLNQIIQFAAKERGLPEVTNFNVARDIMADEVVRLLTSTGGTEADRAGMQSRLSAMMSEYQQTGALTAFERFVAGRFNALEQGYARNDQQRSRDFRETMLTPEAKELFLKHGREAGGAPSAPPGAPAAAPGQAAPGRPQEGQTATNPQTGAKLIYRGGQWVPAQ